MYHIRSHVHTSGLSEVNTIGFIRLLLGKRDSFGKYIETYEISSKLIIPRYEVPTYAVEITKKIITRREGRLVNK